MRTGIFILCALVVYCYAGYPFLMYLLSKLGIKPVRKANIEPTVSIVIAAHNEEDVIERKINNLLSLDYPANKLEICIASDGSTDRTNDLINNFFDTRIHLTVHSQRQGKMSAISQLIAQSKSEIIVFNDARQTLEKDAIRRLVESFADSTVGCVSGELVFTTQEGETAKGINLYWEYEKLIRYWESQVHSMLGATGAIYAIRRELFVPGPSNVVLDDMFIPFKIIEQGYRAIFVDNAHAYDRAAENPKEEYRRKTRTLFGNYQIFRLFPGLFNPLRSPVAVQLFSHKFLRVILPFVLIAIFALTWIAKSDVVCFELFRLQVIFYGMATIGSVVCRSTNALVKVISKVCYIPYVFCLLNFSALVGFFKFVESKQDFMWEKARKQPLKEGYEYVSHVGK
jgi:biofilm PGA synthesis N-glycosyltransferase PgaC